MTFASFTCKPLQYHLRICLLVWVQILLVFCCQWPCSFKKNKVQIFSWKKTIFTHHPSLQSRLFLIWSASWLDNPYIKHSVHSCRSERFDKLLTAVLAYFYTRITLLTVCHQDHITRHARIGVELTTSKSCSLPSPLPPSKHHITEPLQGMGLPPLRGTLFLFAREQEPCGVVIIRQQQAKQEII